MDQDAKLIINEQLIKDYIAYQLSVLELNAFEQYYFEHPQILDDIEQIRRAHTVSLKETS